MTLRKAYYYLFYKLYKFSEAAPSRWWSEWKASLSLMVLEIWILISVMVYYKVFTKKDLIADSSLTAVGITVVISLVIIKYFAFDHHDRWKDYVKEFDKWSIRKNRIGTLVVWMIILFTLGNLIFSFYLMSQIDWKQYR
jgi:hypothetical protein